MNSDTHLPARIEIDFADALPRLDALSELVVNGSVDVVLKRHGGHNVALIDANRWTRFNALAATLSPDYPDDPEVPDVHTPPDLATTLAGDGDEARMLQELLNTARKLRAFGTLSQSSLEKIENLCPKAR